MKPNPLCANCRHVKSLHWRPSCNMVGCPCERFVKREPKP